MNDPYKVLGVTQNSTDDEIKAAYRQLARKYHPDNYQNNPLSDLALEKMKEINEAYDQIQLMRKAGQQRTQNTDYSSYNQSEGASEFADIRRLIMANKITEAAEVLDGVPVNKRTAEWYFLKGNVHYKRGWLEEAMNSFAQANKMDPTNMEYQAAINQLLWQRQTANPSGGYRTATVGGNGCLLSPCDMCTSLLCTDCCCECMGGDCIRCC